MCTANISKADGRKQRRPLRKPAVLTLKNSTEESKRDGRGRGENIPLAQTRLSWKNTDISCTETPVCAPQKHRRRKKTRLNARYRGYMRQVKLREGEGVLLWDEWAVFFNIHQTRVNLDGSEGGWSRDGLTEYLSHTPPYGCLTSLPLLQCLMAILHILDSAMVGQGIVSLGGFLTMCRVRVSRPHL